MNADSEELIQLAQSIESAARPWLQPTCNTSTAADREHAKQQLEAALESLDQRLKDQNVSLICVL